MRNTKYQTYLLPWLVSSYLPEYTNQKRNYLCDSLLLYQHVYICEAENLPWAPAGRGKGGHLPPPGISKLLLLLFISVICITYEGR